MANSAQALMFKFKADQKVFEVGGIKIGGLRSDVPPVLIGSIFYHGHKVVIDERRGEFDRGAAESLIKLQEEEADKAKIPGLLDVVAYSSEAAIKYIDFVSSATDKPFLLDAPGLEVVSPALSYVSAAGLSSRVIFNSLTPRSKDEELALLQRSGVKSAVLLLYTGKVMDVEARLEGLRGLLPRAEGAGITAPLIDTFVIDVPSLSAAMRAMLRIKSELGLPCGCGAHNAVSVMRKRFKEVYGSRGLEAAELASNIAPVVLAADFVLYGPVEHCSIVFPATYVIATSYRYLARRRELLLEM